MGGSLLPAGHFETGVSALFASQFSTVEIDSTFYAIPSRKLVQGWLERTPPGFIFAAKFPQEITHKKLLADCERETAEFLGVMELLGDKLGPLLLQFPYCNQQVFANCDAFLERLARYLGQLPQTHRYAVEVRNRHWLAQPLLELLRERHVPSPWWIRSGCLPLRNWPRSSTS